MAGPRADDRQHDDMDARVMLAVTSHIQRTGYPPGYDLITQATGIRGKDTVYRAICRLEDKGLIERTPDTRGAMVSKVRIVAIDRHVV